MWVKPKYLFETFALMAAATRSVQLELQPSKEYLVQTPFLKNCTTKSNPHSVVLKDTFESRVTSSPAPLTLVSEKIHNGFNTSPTTLAELKAERLSAQIVNDLLPMYIGVASQHVLRIIF